MNRVAAKVKASSKIRPGDVVSDRLRDPTLALSTRHRTVVGTAAKKLPAGTGQKNKARYLTHMSEETY